MAKVISWQLNDTYIYLSGSTIAPQGAVIGANGTVISTEPQSENFISSLSEKWRLSENDSLSVYSDAFNGMLRDIQTLSGATYKVFGTANKYFNVLAENGVIALVGKDGKNTYNSGTSFYNIHILNQNIAIGLGGDMVLDTAVTLETELYIEKDGIIRNDAITNVSAVLKKNDGTEVPVSIVTALTNSTVLVQLTVSGGTDFSEFEGQVAKYQIIVTAFNREGYTYFSVTGVKNGEEGTFFNLVVTPTFIKKANGVPPSGTVKASCVKNGELDGGAVIKYAFIDNPAIATAYTGVINVANFSAETAYFYLFNGENVIDSETCVIVSDGEDATIAARAELDNEMDGVSLGGDNVLDNGATVGSGVKLWTGSSEANITRIEITGDIIDTGVTYYAKPSNLETWSWVSGSTTGATFDFTYNPHTKVDFKIEFPAASGARGGYVFNEDLREVLNIAVTGYGGGNPNVQADASYIIMGVQGGKDGVVYKLMPSRDNVFFDPNTGEYSVTGVTCVAYEGVDIIESPDFGIYYSINDVYNSYSGSLTSGSSVAFSELGMSSVTFYLVWNYRFTNYIVDRETIPVITQGTNARGSIYLELDNEIDGISIGGDDVLDIQTDVSVGFTFYSGTTGVAMTKLTLVATNDFDTYNCVLTCNTGTQYNASFNGDTAEFVIDSSNVTGGTVEITLESGLTFNHTQKFVITLEAEGSDVIGAYRAVYSLFGIKNGVDGVVFKLMPDANSVIYDPNGGVFNPSILRCDAYTGTTAMTKITDFDVYSIRYTINETGATTGDTTGLTSAGVTLNSDDIEKIYFYLFYRIDSDEWVMVDRESIPVIRQGESNFLLDLNNQNASINCDAQGNILPAAVKPSCKATLYEGNSPATNVTYGIFTGSTAWTGVDINTTTGDISLTNNFTFSGSALTLTIIATYNGVGHKTNFNISKNFPGANGEPAIAYWLAPSANAIKVGSQGTASSISCLGYKQEGALEPTTSDTPLILWAFDTETPNQAYTPGTVINISVAESLEHRFVCFRMYENSIQYDIEVIPIVKDGANGASGASVYRLDLDNQNASINCDINGNVLPDATKPSCKATLFYGGDAVPNPQYTIASANTLNYSGISANTSTGVITIYNDFAFEGTTLILTIRAEKDGTHWEALYNISKNLPGADGTPATSYWLAPSLNSIKFEAAGGTATLSCAAYKQTGAEPVTAVTANEEPHIFYAFDTDVASEFVQYNNGSTITIRSTDEHDYVCFKLLSGGTGGTQYDIETVPIVSDGVSGASPYLLDLTNQNASINCDKDGNILPGAVKPQCQVKLTYGGQPVSPVTYTVYTGNVEYVKTAVTIDSSGNITLGNDFAFTGNVLSLTIRATFNTNATMDVYYNISKNIPGGPGEDAVSYWLAPSLNSIKVESDGATPQLICKAYKQEGEKTPTELDLTGTTQPFIYWGYNTDTPSTRYTGETISPDSGRTYICFKLTSGTTEYDIETIPILKDGKDGADGVGSYVLDLDNQNASVNCDINGNILALAVKPSCTATLFYGTDPATGTVVYTLAATSSTITSGSISVNQSTGVITLSNDIQFDGTAEIATIRATIGVSHWDAKYNISKNYPGANGEPATSYWLTPSVNSIKIVDESAAYTISCAAYKQEGAGAVVEANSGTEATIYYTYDTGSTEQVYPYTQNSITIDKTKSYICFKLKYGAVQYDIETVPILRDGASGAPGSSPYILDLDNQNASVNCDSNGDVIAGAVMPTCKATLYFGNTELTTGVAYSVAPNNSGVSIDSSGNITINATTLNFGTEKTLVVTVNAGYNGMTASTKYNISKNVPGANGSPAVSYWLTPSVNSIKIADESATYTISCAKYKQVGGGTVTTPTAAEAQIYYGYNTNNPTTAYTEQLTVDKTKTYICFKLKNTAVTPEIVYDVETVPILRDGASGAPGSSPYILDLDNQNASINCDSSGAILDRAYRPSCKATLYLGNTALTTGVVYAITNSSCTYAGISINSSTGQLTFASSATTPGLSFTDSTLILEITAGYGGLSAITKFNLSKNIGGENAVTYWIEPSQNVVHCAADYEGVITSLTCKVYKQVGENPPQVYPPTGSTQPHLYYRYSTGSTAIIYDNDDGIEVESDDSQLIFELKDTSVNPAIIYDSETIPVLKDGAKGDSGATGEAGRVGVTIRRSVWENNKAYYDGTTNDGNGNYYLDIVTDRSYAKMSENPVYKQCVSSHTSDASDQDYSFSGSVWEEVANSEPLATPLLLAENISADYLDVTRLDVKSGNTYLLRVGSIEEPDYPFLCGGSTSINAVTKIDSAGTFTTVAGMIGGWKITEMAITSNDDTFALDSETKSLVISESGTPRTIINGTINSFNDVLDGGQTQYNVGTGVNTPASSYTYTYYQGWLNHDFRDTHNSPTFEINSPSEVTFYSINFSLQIWTNQFDRTLIEHPDSYEGSIAMSLYAKDSNSNRTLIATKTISWSSLSDANCPFGGSSPSYSMSFTKKTITLQTGTYSLEGYFYLNIPIRSDNPYTGLESQDGNNITFLFTTSRSTTATTSFEMKLNRFFGNGLSTSINSSNAILLFGNDMLTDRFSAPGGYRSFSAESSHFMVISKAGCTASTGDVPTFYENGIDIGTYTGTSYGAPFVSYFRIKLNNDNNWTILSAPNNKLPSYLRVGNCTLWSSTIDATITSTDFHNYKYRLFSGSSSTNTATWTLPGATNMCDGDYMFITPYMGKITLKIGSDMEAFVSISTSTTMVSGPNTVLTIPIWNTALVSFHAAGNGRLPCYFIRIF